MTPSTIFSLIILRRLSFLKTIPRPLLAHHFSPPHFSSPYSVQSNASSNPPDAKPTSLSDRFSFLFDQIDVIERESSQKDDTLQRIRTWHESKKSKSDQDQKEVVSREVKTVVPRLVDIDPERKERAGVATKELELVHPWPEWIELMERLVQQNYFDHMRKDEEKMVEDSGFQMPEVKEETIDFMSDWRTVNTAGINFGRDRFDILRSLSRKHIQILVGYGCPSSDKRVVFSAKLLRKYVHLNEGDVCSSCNLRSSCERGFLLTNKEDEAQTIDVMRILFTYGFGIVNGSVVNDMLLKKKSVKTVIRKLLHEVVKLSAVPIDPNLSPPVIKKRPPKVKQPPPTPRRRVGRADVEIKQGDWLCPKCDFMNFAKNTVCLQCDIKRPQRQLLPGEWECPQCNYLNYRRNTVCFHCEHKRPPDEFTENQKHCGPNTRPDKIPNRSEVSKAWNFDFDDNESDGADIATFEYGDPQKARDDYSQGENLRNPIDDLYMSRRTPSAHEKENYDHGRRTSATGFDDFDDEDDDDVDSYEVDTRNDDQLKKGSSIDFSDVEGPSGSEDADDVRVANPRSSLSRNKSSKESFTKFDSDDELPVHTSWKSSHIAAFEEKASGRVRSSISDDDLASSSDAESTFSSRKNRRDSRSDQRSRKRPSLDNEDDIPGLDSDDEDDRSSSFRNRSKRGGNCVNNKFSGGSQFGSNGRKSTRNDFNRSFSGFDSDDEDRSSSGNRLIRGGNSRGRGGNEFSGDSRFRSNGRKSTGNDVNRSISGFDSDDEDRSSSGNRSIRGGNSRGRGGNEFSGDSQFGSNGRKSTGNDFNRSFSVFDSDDEDRSSSRNRSSNSRGRGGDEFSGGSRFGSNGRKSTGNDFWGIQEQEIYRKSNGFERDDYSEGRRNNSSRNFGGPKSDGFGNSRGGKKPIGRGGISGSSYNNRSGTERDVFGDDRPRTERINVR